MDYYINPSNLTSVFTVPSIVAERHLKFAKAEHIKVLLFVLKNMTAEITEELISEATGVSEYDTKEALLYWADAGVLLPKNGNDLKKAAEPKAVTQAIKPTRVDATRRALEDTKIQYMLREAQIKFGRALKSNETKTLVWLYDDYGLDVSLILLIVQYAAQHNKKNISFIESVAIDWVNKGIDNIIDADAELRKIAMGEQAWNLVSDAFGIERRKASKKELELSFLWVDQWKISKEMLIAAYEECVDRKSKFSFAYVSKIIESWHDKGYENLEDILNGKGEKQTGNSQANDIELFKKMLNAKD